MAGRDITFYIRDFTSEESNAFLYKIAFLCVCFGIHGIDKTLGVTIANLLNREKNDMGGL